jgi:hypothetical protein
MSTYTFYDLVYDVLDKIQKPISEKEMSNSAVGLILDKKMNSKGKTP